MKSTDTRPLHFPSFKSNPCIYHSSARNRDATEVYPGLNQIKENELIRLDQEFNLFGKRKLNEAQLRINRKVLGCDRFYNEALLKDSKKSNNKKEMRSYREEETLVSQIIEKDSELIQKMSDLGKIKVQDLIKALLEETDFSLRNLFNFIDVKFKKRHLLVSELIKEIDPNFAKSKLELPHKFVTREELFYLFSNQTRGDQPVYIHRNWSELAFSDYFPIKSKKMISEILYLFFKK